MVSAATPSPLVTFVTPKLDKILFATDFSDCSRAALSYARAIAQRYGSSIHVVHVLPPEAIIGAPLSHLPAEPDSERQLAEVHLLSFLAGAPLGGVTHHSSIERGPVWEIIAALIQQEDIDLIVLGTHGRRGVKKMVVGSVAEKIFRLSPCPVLTAGPEVGSNGIVAGRLARILYATDFSAGSLHALPYALSLAKENSAHLMLLHAVEDSSEVVWRYLNEAQAAARQRLSELLSEEITRELHPEIVVSCGPATESILKVAETGHADLIVMGAHRAAAHSASTHLPWATVSTVVSHAKCPVLTVRS